MALRALEPGVCEMKRLWVRASCRGSGLGERLVRAVLQRATELGYALIRLDTLGHMDRAQMLYRRFGFREIPAYYDNPLSDVIYLEKSLSAPASTDPATLPVKRVQVCERPSSEMPMNPRTFRWSRSISSMWHL